MTCLNDEQIAMFVVAAINQLPHKQDVCDGTVTEGCCPVCCGPCATLAQLDQAELDDILQWHPGHEHHAWWVDGRFDMDWLYTAWHRTEPCPNHEGEAA